jgi:transcriptional regulator with GAF, ATPase, and Fis domain
MPGLKIDIDTVADVATANDEVMSEKDMKELQKRNLEKALEQANWKVSGAGGAAELLGVRPTTLADRIRTYKLKRPAPR